MWIRALMPLLLAGCAASSPGPVDVLLLGEQHDAADHPRAQSEWVEQLARRRQLAALALEMAERGTATSELPPSATEHQVQQALRWNSEAWPWERYGPVVMGAVRAGVPVLGANLPRSELRPQMNNTAMDGLLPAAGLKAQQDAIREGHCGLLPERQVPGMVRVQIARDLAMAQVLAAAAKRGKTVLLVAGAGHVDPQAGVPRHLPRELSVRSLVLPPQDTGRDYCAELRQQLRRPAS